ncbi:helicase-exonuclease AddAB subunit AddA [Streptococcus sp. DD12]|uniref:helicase-exonuclease AddAB subunit AddA n=1 Tax=Streptococcus sp. DD12 TaxID=1777880 RepID=UPI000796F7E0|nr:helicase-exonuclease AddAB subunit AddA [Streptococcus sp. DD12]KXT76709.1 ATP-dependent nuclease, subunit A [Streptococcus sp. DD12]
MTNGRFLTDQEIEKLQIQEAQSDLSQKRTPEQIAAIYRHGTNILVSASAGSGKTFVMVERIIDMICRGVGIDRLFISTFTVKAARELKERLEKKLGQVISQTQDQDLRSFLAQQANLIQTADIGTMDAFTKQFVNRYGYTIGIAPHFRILEASSERELLKQGAFEKTFDRYMAAEDKEDFLRLVNNFSTNRKDATNFRQQVFAIYDFSQSTASPKTWLAQHFLKGAEDEEAQEAYLQNHVEEARSTVIEAREFFRHHLEEATALYASDKKPVAYLANVSDLVSLLEPITPFTDATTLAQVIDRVYTLGKSERGKALTNQKRPKDPELKFFKESYNSEKNQWMAKLGEAKQNFFTFSVIKTYQKEALPLLKVLQGFVQDFSKAYLAQKRQEGAFDFSDISHFAIQILEEHPEIRQLYQERYVEVMVDEYQDNNHTQEKMLELLSNGHNRFMVGDIKQSIYRFRQADPQIFNQTFKRFQEDPEEGCLIVLKENFRSQKEVLDSTNDLFCHLMDERIGDVAYKGGHELVAGSPEQKMEQVENRTKVLVYDDSSESVQEDSLANTTAEPGQFLMVAKEIMRLHKEEGVAFSEITLLVPTRSSNESISRTFDRLGIPLVTDSGSGSYLESVEVMVMLDTLRAIDNPLQDYALVALLKSAMFAFDEDQLARIALQGDKKDGGRFYVKLQRALQGRGHQQQLITQALKEKLQTFEQTFQKWRSYTLNHSLYELIWTIYNDRFYFDTVLSLPNYAQRQANLSALAQRAQQYENSGFKGLPRFISMIDKVIANQNDLDVVTVTPPENAVTLMTIHSSKGLEFPYVFVLNTEKRFNQTDQKSALVLNRDQGIGIKYTADLKSEFPDSPLVSVPVEIMTLPYRMFQEEEKLAYLSEQMRLLYVAMTRAEKRLYLVGKGSKDKLQEPIEAKAEAGVLPLDLRQTSQNFQSWILAVATVFASQGLAFDLTFVTDEDLVGLSPLKEPAAFVVKDSLSNNRQSDDISQALKRLDAVEKHNQTYQAAIELPSVRTPSQVKKYYEPIMETDGVVLDAIQPQKAQEKLRFSLPELSSSQQATPAAVGSATHELMQRVRLSSQVTLFNVQEALERVDAPQVVKDKVRIDMIANFFEQTPLGQLIQEQYQHIHREAPFAMLATDPVSTEQYVVRGIVDGYLVLEDRLILFDYKTDRYSDPQEIAERYRGQMALYSEALQRSYENKPVESYLILLGGDQIRVIQT